MDRPTVIDLFSGCGGMSWGLEQSGFRTIAGVDNWDVAIETFKLNFPNTLAWNADITSLTPQSLLELLGKKIGDVDCIIGGPPCQGFSKNVPAAYRFFDDPKNHLFKDFLHFVQVIRPKVVVMENVAEIYNAFGGVIRAEIIDTLTALGYNVVVQVLFAPDYGIPQRRRRCFFVASLTGVKPYFPTPQFAKEPYSDMFSTMKKYISAWSAISDLPSLENGEGCEFMPYEQEPLNDYQACMRMNSDELNDHASKKLNSKQFARISSLEPGQGLKNLPDHLRPKSGYSGAYGRLDFEMVSPTITRWVFHPGSGRFGHPRDCRLITIREAARLQSFSDDFRFTGTYIQKSHQVGNAVPPLLMKSLAPIIKDCLEID